MEHQNSFLTFCGLRVHHKGPSKKFLSDVSLLGFPKFPARCLFICVFFSMCVNIGLVSVYVS